MSLFATVLMAAEILVSAPGETTKKSEPKNEVQVPRVVKVTSDRSQYLRKEGIAAFDGNVCLEDVEFQMHADEVTLFLQGTNDLKRVVAIGNVCVTNGCRWGTCAKATYNKELSRVVLFGDEKTGTLARLEDESKRKGSVSGRRITFWTDSQQVDVEGSVLTFDASGVDKDGAKKMLGL